MNLVFSEETEELRATVRQFFQDKSDEQAVRVWIRATARTSLVLFSLAFAARPLRQLWRSPASAWMLRNRRTLGLSFAFSHLLHAIGIDWLNVVWGDVTPLTTLVLGSLGFLWIAAMAATSNDTAVARLGRARWRQLHLSGSWLLWFLFLATNGGNAAEGSGAYVAPVMLCVAVAGLRAAAWQRKRAAAPAPVA